MSRQYICVCKWEECESFRRILISDNDKSHVWNGNIMRIQFKKTNLIRMTNKQFTLFTSIRFHLLSSAYDNLVPTDIYLYPHHFPI